jgi:very-short-patch-repair endonuclease
MSYPVILYPQLISKFRQKYSPPHEEDCCRSEQLRDYLFQLTGLLAGRVRQPDGISDAPLGASETTFGAVLRQYFGERIHTQLRFPIPDQDAFYSVDFALMFPELGLCWDIEVDEPFSFQNNRATHSIDDWRDRYRNTFFLKGNWMVIRFAEEQVVRYPKSCCKELADEIASLTGLHRYQKLLKNVPMLQPIKQWTVQSAKRMNKHNYRSRYLKKKDPAF